jgi:hypothetical protein
MGQPFTGRVRGPFLTVGEALDNAIEEISAHEADYQYRTAPETKSHLAQAADCRSIGGCLVDRPVPGPAALVDHETADG